MVWMVVARGSMADGGAGVAAMRAADGMGGTASVARTAGARGVGGTASATRAGGVGITVGAGRAGGFVGGGGEVEDGGQGVGVTEAAEVSAADMVAKDGVGEGDLETTGGVVTESAVHGQDGGGVGGGAADGVHGVGQAVAEGVDVARRAGAAMAASVAWRAWRSKASLRDWRRGTVPILRVAQPNHLKRNATPGTARRRR